jgi:hypothetical protein
MFVSPCAVRSAQCAALIALATAAGICRVETSPGKVRRTPARDRGAVTSAITPPPQLLTCPSSAATSPHCVAPFTAGRLVFEPGTTADANTAHSDCHAFDRPDPADSEDLRPPSSLGTPIAGSTHYLLSSCTRRYLLPFAIGPPACRHTFAPIAAGTHVPGDAATNGFSRSLVTAPDEDSSPVARVARLLFPSFPRSSTGTDLSPCTARRATPDQRQPSAPSPTGGVRADRVPASISPTSSHV